MNIAIILSGGTGSRMGTDIPKQYLLVKDKMIIHYSLDVLVHNKDIDKIVIVADSKYRSKLTALVDDENKLLGFAEPGVNRQMSIYNALELIDKESKCDYVFIHDAARPNITDEMVSDYINASMGHDGLLPVLPMKDTVYEVNEGQITGLLDRSKIYAGQAPEIFAFDKYYAANKALMPDKIKNINGSTEPAIMAGMDIITVPGNENNYKITTARDLEKFEMEA